jgi:hypothetical protein
MVRCLLLLVALASAHVPTATTGGHHTRETAFRIDDIVGRSWGVYTRASAPMWFTFSGRAGDALSISVSTLSDPERKGLVSATIYGPSAAGIVCEDGWTGWATPADRRLGSADHELFHFEAPAYKEAEFEPFGVGTYLPVTACRGKFPGTGTYFLEATPVGTHETYFTVGAGMNEQFTFAEITTMSYLMFRSFEWLLGDVVAAAIVAVSFLVVSLLAVTYFWYRYKSGFEMSAWRGLVVSGAVLCIPSILIFANLLLVSVSEGVSMGAKFAIPFFVHGVFPACAIAALLFGIARIQENHSPTPTYWPPVPVYHAALVLYLFVGVWQSYLIGPVLEALGVAIYLLSIERFRYALV